MKKILKFLKNKIIPFVCVCSIILSIFVISSSASTFNAGTLTSNGGYTSDYTGVMQGYRSDNQMMYFSPIKYSFFAMTPTVLWDTSYSDSYYRSVYSRVDGIGELYRSSSISNASDSSLSGNGSDRRYVSYDGGYTYGGLNWGSPIAEINDDNYISWVDCNVDNITAISNLRYSRRYNLFANNFVFGFGLISDEPSDPSLATDIYRDVPAMYDIGILNEGIVDLDLVGQGYYLNDYMITIFVDDSYDALYGYDVDFKLHYDYKYWDGTSWVGASYDTGLDGDDFSGVSIQDTFPAGVRSYMNLYELSLCNFYIEDYDIYEPLTFNDAVGDRFVKDVYVTLNPRVRDSASNNQYSLWVSDVVERAPVISNLINTYGYYPVYRFVSTVDSTVVGQDVIDNDFYSLLSGAEHPTFESGFFDFIGDAVAGVLDVEIFDGVSFSIILYAVVGLCVVFIILKYFVGG